MAADLFDTHAKDGGLFGHVSGHLYPGSAFVVLGLWTLYNVVVKSDSSRGQSASRTWFRFGSRETPFEPMIKVALAMLGTVIELLSCQFTVYNKDRSGGAVFRMDSANNMSHISMYGFFFINGCVEFLTHYRMLSAPRYASHFTLGLAYFGVGFLFYFHLDDGRSHIDVTAHVILYCLCTVAGLVVLLQARFPHVYELSLLRAYVILLLGTWFYQIAFSLYMPSHWSLTDEADAMFLPIFFTWHCFAWLALFVVALVIRRRMRRAADRAPTTPHSGDKQGLLLEDTENGGPLGTGISDADSDQEAYSLYTM